MSELNGKRRDQQFRKFFHTLAAELSLKFHGVRRKGGFHIPEQEFQIIDTALDFSGDLFYRIVNRKCSVGVQRSVQIARNKGADNIDGESGQRDFRLCSCILNVPVLTSGIVLDRKQTP